MTDLKWLFFDVGSTLADESRAFEHRIREAVAGTAVTYEQFCETMITYYKQNKKGDLETINHFHLIKTPWHSEDEFLYPEAVGCLERLSRTYKIGIIANQPLGTADRLEAFGILKYIDLVVSSAEEGVAKPDLRMFERALERAACRPEEAVMIGDRLDNDIAPANGLGMHTIWIKQGYGRYSTPSSKLEIPDYTVENLNDVCRLLL